MHALDRGLRRLPGETDEELLERLTTLPYRNRFLGTKSGMKYLVEELWGLTLEEIVEYYADDMSLIVLSGRDQAAETEINISHIFNQAEAETHSAYRQNRVYSEDDLSQAFHFWMSISNPESITFDEQMLIAAINSQKPAHTRAVIYIAA